jgi:calcineurin-like phosphoesterase family protein
MTRARRIVAIAALIALSAAAAAAWYEWAPAPPGSGGFAFVRSVPGPRATIWAVGDGDASAASRALVDRIAAARPDRLLYLGDVYGRGSDGDFRTNYEPTWGRLARITAPTPGNHDWPRHRSGYDPYWQRALQRPRTAAWYAFRAGGWTILSIDSEADHDDGSPQLTWLRSQLRRRGTCRIAFWHRPRFSAGAHHGDAADMAPVWDALRGHAAVAVSGHEHDMQRLHPIDAITPFVSGAGGHSHHALRRDDRRLAFGDDRRGGALRLRLRRGTADYAFVSTAGRVLDRGTLRCRPLQPRGS